ncbi:MAG: dihydrodipicolinate reductase [Actinobacteria bacterium]|nr:dihydrodipicolinate reductase [Actinomycetota bacterium]
MDVTKRYRTVAWATGVVGSAALKRIIAHPQLDLVGVKVYSDDKAGRDAGELVGLPPTGVVTTMDVDEILALRPDCIVYSPMPWDTAEMARILRGGTHIVTPCPFWFPFIQDPETTALLTEACRDGGTNLHASGTNPGGIAERFPLTFSGWCNRIDRITMTEYGDCRDYGSVGVIRELMNLGKTPEEAMNNPIKEALTSFWYEPIEMIAEGLGSEIVDYAQHHDFILAAEPIETAVGTIEAGTIGLNHYRHVGRTREGTEIVQEQVWFMDDLSMGRLESRMDIPRASGWRIHVEGDVELVVDVEVAPDLTQPEKTAQGMSTVGFHCVNAVPDVCDAPDPGIKTYLDLPMTTGRIGTHRTRR